MTKTINLENYEVVEIVNRFNAEDSILNSKDPNKTLPITILWKINRNVKAFKKVYEEIHEMEEKINQEYFNSDKSAPNEEGLREVLVEYRDEFLSKKNDLMTIKTDISIETIPLSSLEGLNFVPADFQSIEMMIDDGEQETIAMDVAQEPIV